MQWLIYVAIIVVALLLKQFVFPRLGIST